MGEDVRRKIWSKVFKHLNKQYKYGREYTDTGESKVDL